MAEEVNKLSPERIQEIFEINRTLDAIVEKIVELVEPTIATLPSITVRIALLDKLDRALQYMREEVRKEG